MVLLLILCFGRSLALKCVSMNNSQCSVRPTLIDLNPDKLHHYPSIVSMSRCDRICSAFKDPFSRICVPNKMEDENLKVFNMIKGIKGSKTLPEHISSKCR